MATTDVRPNDVETIAEPEFIDTASCQCALRPIAERVVVGPENTPAWRCIADVNQDIYRGLSGKWFSPVFKESIVGGLSNEEVTGHPRPDTGSWFTVKPFDDRSLRFIPLDSTFLTSLDGRCTGIVGDQQEYMTVESTRSLLVQRDEKASSDKNPTATNQPHSCHVGPQAVGVPIQNASSWEAVGCLPGFLCELMRSLYSRCRLSLCC